jgi:hypothetical protein
MWEVPLSLGLSVNLPRRAVRVCPKPPYSEPAHSEEATLPMLHMASWICL